MLSNAFFLAKFRFDTAEKEPAKKLQNFAKFANFADPNPLTVGEYAPPGARGRDRRPRGPPEQSRQGGCAAERRDRRDADASRGR